MLPENFPIPPRLFKVLYSLINADEGVSHPAADIEYLHAVGCISPVKGGGWTVNSKGRDYWRRFRTNAAVHDAILSELPLDTILRLKACKHNLSPMLKKEVVDELVSTGYLLHPPSGQAVLTSKGLHLVNCYNKILQDLR